MSNDFVVLLDAGHGGLDKNGKYTTAPGKQFQHSKGTFHKGGWFYEGVWNRHIVKAVSEKLSNLGVRYVWLHHDYLDLSLEFRVQKANWYHRHFANAILVSSHANASPGQNARGFEVYTSRGLTRSDSIATLLWYNVDNLLGKEIMMRADWSDNDPDKEANFYILQRSTMPAILVEHLFFDNYEDALLLMNDEIIEKFAEAQVRTILDHFHNRTVMQA